MEVPAAQERQRRWHSRKQRPLSLQISLSTSGTPRGSQTLQFSLHVSLQLTVGSFFDAALAFCLVRFLASGLLPLFPLPLRPFLAAIGIVPTENKLPRTEPTRRRNT